MNKDIQKVDPTIDSRDVAEMVGKQHAHLCRDIDHYIEVMGQNPKLDSDNFFIPQTYTAGTGKNYTRYDVTRKGCEMIANKLTGEKGMRVTAEYGGRFNKVEQARRGEARAPKLDSETAEKLALQKQKAATAAANARARTSSLYLRAAKMTTNAVWRNVLIATSANVLSGKELIPAPSSKNGRVRHPLGWYAVHCLGRAETWASVLGKKLKKLGIKQSDGETGELVENKAKGCNRQVQSFEWYEDYLVPTIRGFIEHGLLYRAGDVPMEDVLERGEDNQC